MLVVMVVEGRPPPMLATLLDPPPPPLSLEKLKLSLPIACPPFFAGLCGKRLKGGDGGGDGGRGGDAAGRIRWFLLSRRSTMPTFVLAELA